MSDEESLGSEEYEQRIDGDDVDDAEYEQQSTIDDKSIDEKDMTLEQRLNIADKIEFERSNSMGGNHCGRRIKKVQGIVRVFSPCFETFNLFISFTQLKFMEK